MPSVPLPLKMLGLHLRERTTPSGRAREPEPMVMDEPESVAAFHTADPVLQLPVYRLSAESASKLLPANGRVLDLGSGTGRLLAYLAGARQDARIVGTDLAANMLATGREMLEAEGLSGRIELREADMTVIPDELAEGVDLIACVWALHHLPTDDHVRRTFARIAEIRSDTGCAVWIFDFARLRRAQTMPTLVALNPNAPKRLADDGIASEQAAWSADEMRAMLADSGLGDLQGGPAKVVGHFQAYWSRGRESGHTQHWSPPPLPDEAKAIYAGLRQTLPHP